MSVFDNLADLWARLLPYAMTSLVKAPMLCIAKNSTNISLTTGTYTLVTLDTEVSDVYGMHSTSTNPSRVTILTGGAGRYSIVCNMSFASNATGLRRIIVKKNAAGNIASGTTICADIRPAANGDRTVSGASVDVDLADNDHIEVFVQQDSGSTINLESLTDYSPRLSVKQIN